MRVTITEERLSDTDPATGRLYLLSAGDTITVADALGAKWCGLGWATDPTGAVPTGERIPGAREIDVADAIITPEG